MNYQYLGYTNPNWRARERERDLYTHEKIDSCTNEENLFFITDQMKDVIYEPSCHQAIICQSWNDEEINQA